jgi:hypothetical protein
MAALSEKSMTASLHPESFPGFPKIRGKIVLGVLSAAQPSAVAVFVMQPLR